MMYRVIITARVCPILCTRSTACCSTIGFQCGSNTCTLEAEVRLMLYVISQICARNEVSISYPTPPAISEIRNTILEESWWNCCMVSDRRRRDIDPSNRQKGTLASVSAWATRSSILVQTENTTLQLLVYAILSYNLNLLLRGI
jgi:hypothetical protein